MTVRYWIPEDDAHEPRLIARDGRPPLRGRVYDVEARNRVEAAQLVALAATKEPDQDEDPEGWLAWRQATKRVREITNVAPTREPAEKPAPKVF